jgi:hypothetical protein
VFYIRKVLHTSFFPIPDPQIRNTGCYFIHHSSLYEHKEDDSLKSFSFSQFDGATGGNQFLSTLEIRDETSELLLDSEVSRIFTVFLFD